MPRLWQDDRHATLVRKLRALGYVYVTVDLAGFQSGSANLLLGLKQAGRGSGGKPPTGPRLGEGLGERLAGFPQLMDE
jgi:hypothetical protein